MSLFSEVTNVQNVLQNALDPEDVQTKFRDWLFTARDEGHLSTVELLSKHDHSGWTPQEHAAYRGYVGVAKFLEALNARNTASTPGNPFSGTEAASLMPQSGEHLITSHVLSEPTLRPPIKTTQLLINLGSFDTKKAVAPVDLDPYLRMNDLHSQAGLSIEISADGADGPSQVMQLPVPEDVTDKLWVFSTTDPSEVKLLFNILRQLPDTHGEGQTALIGRGIASLKDLKRGLGAKRESLIRDCSIAILEKDTLNSIGTVTFTFLVANPFSHEQSAAIKTDDLWNRNGPLKVVGHRGSGQKGSTSIEENTMQSFETAFKDGASYVELDVQVTKDHVAVVYHDFIVSETGTEAPMHTLTLSQFTNINPAFLTLEKLLQDLPEANPLNIEIKYPMLFEAEDLKMETFAIELNTYVDTILSAVFQASTRSRPIVFSSFSPEACILLSLKQARYPILFLSDGIFPVGDIRASSALEAVRFAKAWRLGGLVMESAPLVLAPRLIGLVRQMGLVCASYGVLNDDPKYVKIQADAGLDIIIVDGVPSTLKTLRNSSTA